MSTSLPSPNVASPASVLAVDDESDAQDLYRRALWPLGYDVLEAPDAQAALEVLETTQPGLVLLDLGMPGPIDGFELCRQIRSEHAERIPLIAVTGANPSWLGDDLPVDEVIRKPIDVGHLRHRVSARLPAPQPSGEGPAGASRDDLAALLIHDFKGPLATLRACHAFLERRLPEASPDVREALSDANEATGTLMSMVLNLLDIAQLESATDFPLQPSQVDLSMVVREIGRAAQRRVGRSRRLRLRGLGQPVPICLDESLVRRALDNLIDNAIRHTPTGGPVTVELETCQTHAKVAITDSGPGIPDGEKRHIFDKFRRGSGSGRTNRGLGLYLCRLVATAHGGQVTVVDGPGGGSTFLLSLPRRR